LKSKAEAMNESAPQKAKEHYRVHNEDPHGDSHADLWKVGQWIIEITTNSPALPCRLKAWTGNGMEEWEAVRAEVDPVSRSVLFPGFHYHILFIDRVPYYFRKLKAMRLEKPNESDKDFSN